MHYRHRLAKRTAHRAPFAAGVVGAVERAGVRLTYDMHDRIRTNPASRRLFESHPPVLDEAQREVVDALRTDGVCVVPFTKLFPEERWRELSADAATFTPDGFGSEKKPFGRRFAGSPSTLESPWLRLAASARMLDVVNTYLGMWSKLTHSDQWYAPPRGSEAERVGSMRWHRDYNDRHLVKVFVYLCDVDEGTGPFEYVPGSARGGPYAGEWPWRPLSELYPTQDEFEQRIPDAAVKTLTGPEGSMIFCNTSGFHRGGHVTEKPRNMWVLHYVSPAALRSLVDRNFEPGPGVADLSDVERYAVT
jgi:hypothetical protein